MGRMRWLERYRAGEHAQVWREIDAEGLALRKNSELWADARDVATDTMRRVRRNAETLSGRWEEMGFEFGYDWLEYDAEEWVERQPPHIGRPTARQIAALDRFEKERGPLPLALRAFYEVVGAVNFVGTIPDDWPFDREKLDPLQICGFTDQLEELIGAEKPEVTLFPDPLVKYNISGVGAVYAPLPDASSDVTMYFEGSPWSIDGEVMRLLPYLRTVIFDRGGIGFGSMEDLDDELANELTLDLVPF